MVEHKGIKPIGVRFDTSEPGFPGVTIRFSDGTEQWFDAKQRRLAEESDNIPTAERIDGLPPIVE